MGGKSSELEQCVVLKLLGKADIVEVVEAVDRVTQSVVVFFFDQQSVVRVIDRLDVELRKREWEVKE